MPKCSIKVIFSIIYDFDVRQEQDEGGKAREKDYKVQQALNEL